jgi:hypothetical protein
MTMNTEETIPIPANRQAWNSGRIIGAKCALKPKQIWEIRFFLNQHHQLRDRALFGLAIDSKLRGCDIVSVKIGDLVSGEQARARAIVVQKKNGAPCSIRGAFGCPSQPFGLARSAWRLPR